MEYYSVIKMNKIMAFVGKWMKLENIMLNEISQYQKTKGQMFSLISGCWYMEGVGKCRNFRLCRGKWGDGGGRRKERWWKETNHYPMYKYDYTNGVNLHGIETEQWKVLHLVQWIRMHFDSLYTNGVKLFISLVVHNVDSQHSCKHTCT